MYKKEISQLTPEEIKQAKAQFDKANRLKFFKAQYTNKHGDKADITLNCEGASDIGSRAAYMFGVQYGIEFARSQDAHDKAATDAILTGIKTALGVSIEAETKH